MNYAEALATLSTPTKKISRVAYGSKYITRNFESNTITLVLHDGAGETQNWFPPLVDILKTDWVEV